MFQFLGPLIGLGASLWGSNKAGDKAKQAAKATKPTPYEIDGPAGSVDIHGNQIKLTPGHNPFSDIFQKLGLGFLGNAGAAGGQFLNGADPELASAYKGLFGQGLTDRIQDQYDLLTELEGPAEQRQRLALDDGLFASGMLGTTGGAERFRALEEVLGQADLRRKEAAIGLGRQEALDRFTGAQGAVDQGMAGQLQDFNMGQGAFGGMQQILENLFRQAGIGVAAGGGQAPGAAMYAAQAAGAPYRAAGNFLQNSGAFDAMGSWLSKAFQPQQTGLLNADLSQWGIDGNFGL